MEPVPLKAPRRARHCHDLLLRCSLECPAGTRVLSVRRDLSSTLPHVRVCGSRAAVKGVLKAFQAARRSEGVDRIIAILESQGYEQGDIDEIARALSDESISAQLIDADTGQPIETDAGLKSGDPVMMIEAAIAQNSTALGQQGDTATEQAGNLIRNQINALILATKGEAGVNEQALQQVAQITYNTFTSGMTARLGRATGKGAASV